MFKTSMISLAALTAVCLTGCGTTTSTFQSNGVPRHDNPQEPWWHYMYVYHPEEQVYFEPYTKTYHWFENGAWWTSDRLPQWIVLDASMATVVKSYGEQPHFHHTSNASTEGPGHGHAPNWGTWWRPSINGPMSVDAMSNAESFQSN